MLSHAFKEWAVICRALAEGKQGILIRKGGIAEPAGDFKVEQTRFWLYPTFVHQQKEGIKPEAAPLLEEALRDQPLPGTIRLSHWAEVTGIYHVHDLIPALMLSHLHLWSDQTIDKRFHYKSPGLFVLAVRVYRTPETWELPETDRYLGCKSWVELDQPLPTDNSTPVLDEKRFADVKKSLDLLLSPRAYA